MDVQTLGQGFVDLVYPEDPSWYDDEDGHPVYEAQTWGDNVHWSEVEEIFYSGKPKTVGGSEVSLEEQFGGEGKGEEYYLVFRVENPDGTTQFFRVDGYYSSYDGSSWDGAKLKEVRAVPRTVVFFE